jgi:transcriptional regulator with XRE-family HTH domain
VSLGYLSEVERGQKEASSELLAAICSALGTPLSQVFREVADNFALAELQNEPVFEAPREPKLPAASEVAIDVVRTVAPGGEGMAAEPSEEFRSVQSHVRDVTDMVPV